MSSSSKRKGTAWETLVVRAIQEHGWPYAERRVLHGTNDLGDVINFPGWTIEAKNQRAFDLSGWMKELDVERKRAGTPWGALVVKRPRYSQAEDAYAVMRFGDLLDLIYAWSKYQDSFDSNTP